MLWDQLGSVLVVVPQGRMPDQDRRLPKIVMRPNQKTKFGTALSVVSPGSAELSDLLDRKRYLLRVGALR